MALYLGIDGGGSKTQCAVGDEFTILGRGAAGTAKLTRVTEKQARENLRAAIEQACAAAGVTASQIARACYGVAGVSNLQNAERARKMASEITDAEIVISGDMNIALEAAFSGGPGMVVVAGTGSIAYGSNERGDTARAGGWGPIISDEGSGDWIGRAAVALALRAHDAGETTSFMPAIMNTWHLATYDDVVRYVGSSPPPDFAALFPHVNQHATEGDDLARGILLRAAAELSEICHIVLRRLWPAIQAPAEVAMTGGVFRNSSVVRDAFSSVIRGRRPHVRVALCERDPVEGALAMARRKAAGRSIFD